MQQFIHYIKCLWRPWCLLFALSLAVASTLRAQSPPEIRPLTIGDTVPDIVFQHMLNYKDSTARLSDFRGKLVILDFWSSWCGGCIGLFPDMNRLQRQFGDSLQIILVNGKSTLSGDDAPKIWKVINRVNTVDSIHLQLPVVYNCPVLDSLFTYRFIPHEVWIDHAGRVIAVTSGEEVTASHIKTILAGKEPAFRMKNDDIKFDGGKPLFVDGNAGNGGNILYRSLITGYSNETVSRVGVRRNQRHQIIGLYVIDRPLNTLLYLACPECSSQQSLVIDETNHRIPLTPADRESRFDYLYCYDLVISPVSSMKEMALYIRRDIERCFHITIAREKRNIKCLILKTTSRINVSIVRSNMKDSRFETDASVKYLRNYPVTKAVELLNGYLSLPLVDETGLNAKIDMALPDDLNDQQAVVQALKDAGFSVKEGRKEMEVTVIKNTPI